ncbi:MAG: DEAD/DEAH box helicase [Actinobacteria bacterium]|nr:DEAD/DEAH box helicase [Actinomycetota bacterium]
MSSAGTGLHPGVEHHVVNTLGWPDLRPLQRDSVEPVRRGDDCLLLAPTAGGKTEAAFFPLLSQMADAEWRGLSVLYVTPLRALLNNLHPRLTGYASWVGRTVGLWHGDTTSGERRRLLADPPDVLLTTPESLEAMLVSANVDHLALFAHLRVVVVDELHAFAGDDRGWHLLSVLERLQRLAGRRLQRIGLTATVGNPDELLSWLQGAVPASRATVVAPESSGLATPDITVDYVGSIDNAATVVASLHGGEKRLVFSDSRSQAEDMARALRERGITTFVSHSSLSADERHRSEQAFAEARDCVVVATSTLELGIDVGDLDRVIQLEAPRTVASFLQRLGRTGRRAGSTRSCLFLATREDSLLRAAALTHLWGTGFVEPVVPPPHPRHIAAQQFMALALQEGQFGSRTWREWWGDLAVMADGQEVLDHLAGNGFLEEDSGMLFIGQQAERHFGRRHFMDLLAVFTADPEMKVLLGRRELGSVSPLTVTARLADGEPRLLVLAGRTWLVTSIDWRRRTINVVEHAGAGRSRWAGGTPDLGYELVQSVRQVLLGDDPPVELSHRAIAALDRVRAERAAQVDPAGTVVQSSGDTSLWWTFAGTKANSSLAAALSDNGVQARSNAESVTLLDGDITAIRNLDGTLTSGVAHQSFDPAALEGLKFSAALPLELAERTLAERGSDSIHAAAASRAALIVR